MQQAGCCCSFQPPFATETWSTVGFKQYLCWNISPTTDWAQYHHRNGGAVRGFVNDGYLLLLILPYAEKQVCQWRLEKRMSECLSTPCDMFLPSSFCRKTWSRKTGREMHLGQLFASKANVAGILYSWLWSGTGGNWKKSPESTS